MKTITLNWKEFNVNLDLINNKMKTDHAESFYGASADSTLRLHFADLKEEQEQELLAWWEALTSESTEAQYKSQAELQAEKDAVKQTALAKLQELGLTVEQLKALGL